MKGLRALICFLLSCGFIFTMHSCSNSGCTINCQNGGTCYNGLCQCPTGYEGANCQTLSRQKFISSYYGSDSCGHLDTNDKYYYVYLVATPGSNVQMTLLHLANNGNDSALCTVTDSTSFSFAGSNYGTSFRGTGKLIGDTLRLSYSYTIDTFHYNCSFAGLK
jgi:hypothetical protein